MVKQSMDLLELLRKRGMDGVTVQSWWVELAEGGLPNAGAGGSGYVIYRAWIPKLAPVRVRGRL